MSLDTTDDAQPVGVVLSSQLYSVSILTRVYAVLQTGRRVSRDVHMLAEVRPPLYSIGSPAAAHVGHALPTHTLSKRPT